MKKFKAWFTKNMVSLKLFLKERFRKVMVKLKRRPYIIPLLMLVISCLVLNLNLTSYSNTVAYINEPGMGICLFIITLCSYLMIIGFVTAFPNRQKPKIVSIILVCIMIIITIVGQAIFQYFIRYATELKSNPIKITSDQFYILSTKRNSIVHMIINAISLLLIFTIPVYGKLLKKINTKVDVEDVIIEEINLVEDDEIY